MRRIGRRTLQREGEESAFVSMTDMTVSFLFIIMLLMAFFATRYADETKLEAYLQQTTESREQLLRQLQEGIREHLPNLEVTLSAQGDALRFRGENLFATNRSELQPRSLEIVEAIADVLGEVLPCYTRSRSAVRLTECSVSGSLIEAVQIEGHTDNEGLEIHNLVLSTARANVTFDQMVQRERTLTDQLNFSCVPVLSVAGYGWMRPVAPNDTPEGRARNRRIDLRVIMHAPARADDIETVIASLDEPCGVTN